MTSSLPSRRAFATAWASIDLQATSIADRVRSEVGDHGPESDRGPPAGPGEAIGLGASTSWVSRRTAGRHPHGWHRVWFELDRESGPVP
jgi:hypothetical protein